MSIDEFLWDPQRRTYAAMPEADALTEEDALQEAQLLDVRLDVLRSTVWLLFDCKGAVQIEMGNTAILVAHGVDRYVWSSKRRGRYTAWSVVGSEPHAQDGFWTLALTFAPSARLEMRATSAEFFVGDVPGCDEPQPDYGTEDDETIRKAGVEGLHQTLRGEPEPESMEDWISLTLAATKTGHLRIAGTICDRAGEGNPSRS